MLGQVGLAKVKGQSKGIILSTAFSNQIELKVHQSAGLPPRQREASYSCSFLFGGTGRRGKEEIYRRLNWPSDMLS